MPPVIACTLAGLFAAVAMKLLDFVGLYGTTLAPPLLFIFYSLTGPRMKNLMLAGCILWFATVRFFMQGGAR